MKTEIKQQTKADKVWTDETGSQVQYLRTKESERFNEKIAFKTAKTAIAINADLMAFKEQLRIDVEKSAALFMKENGIEKIGKGKGGFSFTNFDGSIKIEVSANEQQSFDEQKLQGAKAKLDKFLEENVSTTTEIIKELVMSAFSTSKGQVDNKRIMKLLSYRSKVKNAEFIEALDLLQSGIKVTGSKTYYRVWLRQEDGSYALIDLNFSSI